MFDEVRPLGERGLYWLKVGVQCRRYGVLCYLVFPAWEVVLWTNYA